MQELLAEKMPFLKAAEAMLIEDQNRNWFESLAYEVEESGGGYEEYVHINRIDGTTRKILVTASSNVMILKAILKSLYGKEVI